LLTVASSFVPCTAASANALATLCRAPALRGDSPGGGGGGIMAAAGGQEGKTL
jgi:hypothetical protein